MPWQCCKYEQDDCRHEQRCTKDTEIDNDIEETEWLETLVNEAIKVQHQIQTVCCAQHVLQLVINDKIKEIKPHLTRVRKFVKVARCSYVKAYLNNKVFSYSVLDVVTPWGSTYIYYA